MKHCSSTVLLIFAYIFPLLGNSPYQEISGKLNKELCIESGSWGTFLFNGIDPKSILAAELSQKVKLGFGDVIQSINLPAGRLNGFILESFDSKRTLAVDLNRNGTISPDEMYPFSLNQGVWEASFSVPLTGKAYRELPIRIRYTPEVSSLTNAIRMDIAAAPFVCGSAMIGGRETRFVWEYDALLNIANVSNGWVGVDSNNDRTIDFNPFSIETAFADNEVLVFKQGGSQFVSTKSVDIRASSFTVRLHPSKDYKRIEVAKGRKFPGFPFRTLRGDNLSLVSYKNKIVLLVFGTPSCGPCLTEIPQLKEVYEKFRHQGFEVLGVLCDDDFEDARAIVKRYSVPWQTAASHDVSTFVKDRLRLASYPSHVLVDKKGYIISVGLPGEPLISSGHLSATLNELLKLK